jgi:hypothetical protein
MQQAEDEYWQNYNAAAAAAIHVVLTAGVAAATSPCSGLKTSVGKIIEAVWFTSSDMVSACCAIAAAQMHYQLQIYV